MRLIGLLLIVMLAACASHDRDEEALMSDPPAETIDLMAEDESIEQDSTQSVETPAMPVRQTYQQPTHLRSYYPIMRGYKVDKSVEVFPLDDWQPPARMQ